MATPFSHLVPLMATPYSHLVPRMVTPSSLPLLWGSLLLFFLQPMHMLHLKLLASKIMHYLPHSHCPSLLIRIFPV